MESSSDDQTVINQALAEQQEEYAQRLAQRIRAPSEHRQRLNETDLWLGRIGLSSRALVFLMAAVISLCVVPTSLVLLFLYHDNCEVSCTAVNLLTLIIGIWVPNPSIA